MNSTIRLLKEIGRFIIVRRQWALGILLVFLLLLGILVALAQTHYLVPFIYTMY